MHLSKPLTRVILKKARCFTKRLMVGHLAFPKSSLLFVVTWLFIRHWLSNNLIACALATVLPKFLCLVNKLRRLAEQYWTCRDHTFVPFFSVHLLGILESIQYPQVKTVMVEVATSFERPTSFLCLLFSHNHNWIDRILSLGDIVIHELYQTNLDKRGNPFNINDYFTNSLIHTHPFFVIYLSNIILFDLVKLVLLYILPCLFTATYISGMLRGKLSLLRTLDVKHKIFGFFVKQV